MEDSLHGVTGPGASKVSTVRAMRARDVSHEELVDAEEEPGGADVRPADQREAAGGSSGSSRRDS